jgi:hypothetical protein
MRFSVRLVTLVFAVSLSGCGRPSAPVVDSNEEALLPVDRAVVGTWRMVSYTPEVPLTGVLLMGLQRAPVVVRFDGCRAKSATPEYSFDRAYRLSPPIGETFKVWIADDQGIETECWARFETPNRIVYEGKIEPWRGVGVLERVGP